MQIGANVRGILVAQVAVFLESLVDSLFELRGKIGIQLRGRRGGAVKDAMGDDVRTLATEGQDAGGHFIKHNTEGEQIGAGIEFHG